MSKLDRVRRLSLREGAVLAQLAAFCAATSLALRIVSWRRVSQIMTSGSQVGFLRSFPFFHFRYAIEELGPLLEMASGVSPRNRCLVRSLVLLWLLRARGESAEVVLGVRKRAGVFEAHAWTVSERGLVGDRPEAIAEFQPLTSSGKQVQL
jgi:hypothetical protein